MIHCDGLCLQLTHRPVLSDVTWHIEAGSVWGIIGPPASGKSVLAKTLCGLFTPRQGRLIVDGVDLPGLPEPARVRVRRKMGMLFQNNALFDFLRVRENVAFPLARQNPEMPQDELVARAQERLRAVGLSGSEEKWPSELSGGMKKRVGIARATICNAPVLIYDEPTAGLDPVTTSKIYDLLTDLRQKHASTVIAISSDIPALRHFVDHILFLHQGRIRYCGPESGLEACEDPVVYQFVRGQTEGPL
ncbi:ATP-binding cassette domain-containing protein [Myxococcota bacterium]|nr:ATP-binding cassette domain-containing protein [Myxococcota bacterium]